MEKVCQHCGTINNSSNPVCTKCGYPFDMNLETVVKNRKYKLINHKEIKKPSYIIMWYIIFFAIAITIYNGLFYYIPKAYELYIGPLSGLINKLQTLIYNSNISEVIKQIIYYTIINVIPPLIGYYIVTIIVKYFTFKRYTVPYGRINMLTFDIFLLYLVYALILSLISLFYNDNIIEIFLKNLIPLTVYLPIIKKVLVKDYIIE